MKYLTILAVLALVGCESEAEVFNDSELNDVVFVQEDEPIDLNVTMNETELLTLYGSEAALETDNPSIEAMLLYAIEDELRAKAEYEMIMETYDITRPFSNLAVSEERHIEMLLPLLEAYDISIDHINPEDHLIEINSLLEAYQVGVIAEIDNIAMYDMFLTLDITEELVTAFTALRDGSINHLAAFEKGVSRTS